MKLHRHIDKELANHFKIYKQALVLMGARQTGKTTVLKKIFPNAKYLLVDNEQTKQVLETYDINNYSQVIGDSKQIIIDELHLLSDPGRTVKIIYDQIPNLQLIVTGSSSLHIKNKTTESMAGRKIEYKLFPLTFSEYLLQKGIEDRLNFNILKNVIDQANSDNQNSQEQLKKQENKLNKLFSPEQLLSHILLYGLYPEQISIANPRKYLIELADSAIFKDIVELNLIENRSKAKDLLKILAYQIGNLVNYSEIATKISLDRRTVERYIEIFEQSYILFRVYPYATRTRDEIGKIPKVYFHDLGLRNALIDNFDPSPFRLDYGAMFENFFVSEINKILKYQQSDLKLNYWRLRNGSEVDILLSNANKLYGIEVKLKKSEYSKAFTNRYPLANIAVINKDNFY